MTIKSTLGVVALLSGIALSGSAFAQTMVGSHEVSETDLPIVQQHCDALALADQNSGAEAQQPSESTTNADSQTNVEEDTAALNASSTVDLDTITLEDCRTAGLVQ